MENLVKEMFENWKSGEAIPRRLLSSDFRYIGPSPLIDTDTWLNLDENEASSEMAEIISLVKDEERCALLFEMMDTLTNMKYRVSWFIKSSGSTISELIEIKQPVESFILLK
jgi:hypothetical protein